MSGLVNRRTVGRELAELARDAALSAAEREGLAVGVAVVGSAGELVVFAKMDGAPPIAEHVARDKAYTAVATGGVPTAALADALEGAKALVLGLTNVERIIVFGGGVPIVVEGEVVGAVGVSGGSAEQDAAVAQAGADHAAAAAAGP